MRSFALFGILLLLSGTASAATSEVHHLLISKYGLRLVDGPDSEPWASDEVAAVATILPTLPSELATVGRKMPLRRINVFKGDGPLPERTHIAPLPIMHWQMVVDIAPDDARTDRDAYLRRLQRRVVHHLLHVFDAQKSVSRSDDWRRLSGWRSRQYLGMALPIPKEADNQDPRGYATPDGLVAPEADFASYGELYFIPLDEERIEDTIACRTPEKFRFFTTLFASVPSPMSQVATHCRGSSEGFLDDLIFFDPITRQPLDLGPVNPDTVEGFELLYATPGVQDAAEIAGHLVLRIRLRNNPGARSLGVENPHDLVVSFLADTEAKTTASEPPKPALCEDSWLGVAAPKAGQADAIASVVQALKGLSGGFLTTFDRQTLQQTIRTYTIDQDRNLLRYRLNVTERQKSRLIERLYAAKKNYKTKYYFFDRNCASVLVQVIGEGLGVRQVADFDPMVVPPNALVALLVRQGLATPVYPSFYGYRKRAHVAQEMLRDDLAALSASAPDMPWPKAEDVVSKKERRRLEAYQAFADIAARRKTLAGPLYRLATIGQEAEMAFVDKSAPCEHYASRTVESLRNLQQRLLVENPDIQEEYAIDVNRSAYARYAPQDAADNQLGSNHTHLSSVSLGSTFDADEKPSKVDHGLHVGVTLHRQDLGAISNQSMQRATSVILGETHVDLLRSDSGTAEIGSWSATGMKIRKFKERLDKVPTYLAPEGSLGLGLTVLDWRGRSDLGLTQSDLVGGELLANLVSSRLYDDYLLLSIGANVTSSWDRSAQVSSTFGTTALTIPVYLEGLTTFGLGRRWQLRGKAEVRYALLAGGFASGFTAEASLVHRLVELQGSELLLRIGGVSTRDPVLVPDGRSSLDLGFEWIRW